MRDPTGQRAAKLRESGVTITVSRKPGCASDGGLVVRRCLPGHPGLACATATTDADALLDRGARHLFLMPWRDLTLIGVWPRESRSACNVVTRKAPAPFLVLRRFL